MGAAAAAESPDDANNVTMNSIDDAPIGVSEDAGGAEMLLGASNDENILSTDSGSFKDLEDYINANKGYGKTVYLNQDYAFNNETDSDYNVTGIYLGTYVTIDGQGNTIDASNTRYIFNVIGQDVVIKNIVFKNTNYRAIEVASPNVEISGCTFDNNTGRAVGLSTNALNCIIDDCTFTNGQGLYSEVTGAVIRNSLFKNNTATNGGAIQIAGDSNVIENCEFINNTATSGGAIFFNFNNTDLTVINSNFEQNTATSGGAIYNDNMAFKGSNYISDNTAVNIISSNFGDNKAVNSPQIYGNYTIDDSTVIDEPIYYA